MKASTIHELKNELTHHEPGKLLELCLRLARFKKENKELLTYLLFEAHDERSYIQSVKAEIDADFEQLPKGSSLYLVKKSLRKTLRKTNKYIRYSGEKTTEIELLLYYCSVIKKSGIPVLKSTALTNLFNQQLKKITKTLTALHEDLQYDYLKELEALAL